MNTAADITHSELSTLIRKVADIELAGFMLGPVAVMFSTASDDCRVRVRFAAKTHGHESPWNPDCAGTHTLCAADEDYDRAASHLRTVAGMRSDEPLTIRMLNEHGRIIE